MEKLVESTSWNKTSNVNDPKLHMATRPTPPSTTTRRTGMAAEAFGSSFAKTSSQSKKPTRKRKGGERTPDSGSSDELNSLPPRGGSRSGSEVVIVEEERDKNNGFTDNNGVHHDFHASFPDKSSVLKSLKFKKNKAPQDDNTRPPDASSSQPLVAKENRNRQPPNITRPLPLPRPSQPSKRLERSPARTTRKRSPSPVRPRTQGTAPKARVNALSETTRPKPRPLGRRVTTAQLVPQAFPGPSPSPSSPERRSTISGLTSPLRDRSPPQRSENVDPAGNQSPAKKKKASDFPLLLSPRRPSEFPSLDTLGSQGSLTIKKGSEKGSVSEKFAVIKPPPRMRDKKESAETRIRKRLSTAGANSRRNVVVSSEESDGEPEKDDAPKARPFPMNTQMFSSIGPATAGSSKLKRSSSESYNPDNAPTAQPFPMSSQVLGSIGSSPPTSGSSSLKRLPSENCEEPDSKKRKERILDLPMDGDEDGEDGERYLDPSTLCPYCDAPLPSEPTSELMGLLAAAKNKSSREPRPGNSLGRTAPFTVYIAVCQRHRFESEVLPQAERKGWPKIINWSGLAKRVRKMKSVLRSIIDDAAEADSDAGLFGDEGPRARCVFWREAMAEVKQKGTRAVAGVRGQFATFEKMQPGYYGEVGSLIIHQTLYDLIPPASIDPVLVLPLTASEFLQRILVPEIGVRLIMQDMDLDESRMKDAVKILRESADYGVAMFPADEGEEGGGGGGREDDEMDAADKILMKRAMKRRKELDVDERGEEEEFVRQMAENAKGSDATERSQRKLKEKGNDDEPPELVPQVPRPRPRPLGKTISTTSIIDNVEMVPYASIEVEKSDADDESTAKLARGRKTRRIPSDKDALSPVATNTDTGANAPAKGSRPCPRPLSSRSVSRHSEMDIDVTPQPSEEPRPKPRRLLVQIRDPVHGGLSDTDATPRKPKAPQRKPSSVSINLCSSSEDSTDHEWDVGRMTSKPRGKQPRIDVSGDEVVQVAPPPSSQTPVSSRLRKRTLFDSEDTPKPRVSAREKAHDAPDFRDNVPPLQRARERKARLASASSSRQLGESYSWLLSDSSSIETIRS